MVPQNRRQENLLLLLGGSSRTLKVSKTDCKLRIRKIRNALAPSVLSYKVEVDIPIIISDEMTAVFREKCSSRGEVTKQLSTTKFLAPDSPGVFHGRLYRTCPPAPV